MRALIVVATLAIAALAVNGCGAQVPRNTISGVDADDSPDGPPQPPDAKVCARKVYLSFGGESLMRAAASNAKLNQASWMTIANGAAPPYLQGNAGRDAAIAQITSDLTQRLAAFDIEVVTTRPTSGDYMMIIYGGQANQVGSNFGGAVQELDCNDAFARNDVAWVSDGVRPLNLVVNFSMGAIGFGLGLTATNDPAGCMCGWDNLCNPLVDQPCVLSSNIPRDPAANQVCNNAGATQDEIAAFTTTFCQ